MKKVIALILLATSFGIAQEQTFHIAEIDSSLCFVSSRDTFQIAFVNKKRPKDDVWLYLPIHSGTLLTSGDTLDFSNAVIRMSAISGQDYDTTWTEYMFQRSLYDSLRMNYVEYSVNQIGQRLDIVTAAVMDSSGLDSLWGIANSKITEESYWRQYNDEQQTNQLTSLINLETTARMGKDTLLNDYITQAGINIQSEATTRNNGDIALQSAINLHTQSIDSSRASVTAAKASITVETSNRVGAEAGLQAAINLRATTARTDSLTGRIDSVSSNLRVEAGKITAKVDQTVYNALAGTVSAQASSITQLSNSITSKVNTTDFNALSGTVSFQGTSISQLANSITSKVDQTVFNTLSGTVTTQGTSITQLNNSIASKVGTTEFNLLSGTVSNQASSITQLNNNITSKVDVTTFNTLQGTVTTQGSQITQNGVDISLKVSKNGVISAINQSAEAVTIDAAKISLNGAVIVNGSFSAPTIDGNITFPGGASIYGYGRYGSALEFTSENSGFSGNLSCRQLMTDIPIAPDYIGNLPWSKITSGKPTTLAGYGITDAPSISVGAPTMSVDLQMTSGEAATVNVRPLYVNGYTFYILSAN